MVGTNGSIGVGVILNKNSTATLVSDYIRIINSAPLIIGGVGNTITSKALLAEKFTFTEAEVVDFLVFEGTVYASINNTNYKTIDSAFANNNEITSITEKMGYLKEFASGSFYQSISILKADCPGVTIMNVNTFAYCTNIPPSAINVTNLKTLSGLQIFRNIKDEPGYEWVFPKLTSSSSSFIDLQASVTIEKNAVLQADCFYGFNGTINIKNVTALGAAAVNNGIFNNINAASIINCHPILKTIDNGNPDADLVYAAGRGATINYIGGNEGETFIAGSLFTIHKHPANNNPNNKYVQEINDVIEGYTPAGDFITAKYHGGDITDFNNPAVYTIFGGI